MEDLRKVGSKYKIAIPKTRAELQYHLRDPLLRNSLFMMLTAISGAGFVLTDIWGGLWYDREKL